VLGHEINRLRRHLIRGHGQIALILPILIIHKDDHLSLFNVFNGFFDCVELHLEITSVQGSGFRVQSSEYRVLVFA